MSDRDHTFILGVDLDGVVADHTRRFREIYAGLRGIDPESLPLERSWDFHEWGLDNEQYSHYHRIAVMEHDMFRTMPLIEGAADALWRLSDAGIWIRIITHRLYVHWGHEKAVGDTAAWLDANRIPYRDLCFLGAKPQVEADAYIDDAPHNIEQLRAAGNTVIAFDQPYNRALEGGPRAADWAEVESIVTELAAERLGSVEVQLPGIDSGADRIDRRREH
ncbi:MAG: 5' nucleotidase, NT5C type [Acidimicrobiia bacterium]